MIYSLLKKIHSIYLHVFFIEKQVDNNRGPFKLSWISARFWRCCLNCPTDVNCFRCTSSSFAAQEPSCHATDLEACKRCIFLPETMSKEWIHKRLREWVKEKGKVRFPFANVFSPVKERALEIKWSECRAKTVKVLHPAGKDLDQHSEHFSMHLHFIFWNRCLKNAGVQETNKIKSATCTFVNMSNSRIGKLISLNYKTVIMQYKSHAMWINIEHLDKFKMLCKTSLQNQFSFAIKCDNLTSRIAQDPDYVFRMPDSKT